MPTEPYKYFLIEAREILDAVGRGVLALERQGKDPGLVSQLLRHAHTLKGAARVVKQREIAELAHSIEGLLVPLRDQDATATGELVSAVLRLLDEIQARIAALTAPATTEGARSPAQDAHTPAKAPTPQDAAREPVAAPLGPIGADTGELTRLLDELADVSTQVASLRRSTAPIERARALSTELTRELTTHAGPQRPRMRAALLELSELLADAARTWDASAARLDRDLTRTRESAERLRLVPARVIFSTLERAARDSALSLGKAVTVATRGGDLRLEGRTLTVVQGALVQAIRNAVAHGIEPEPERLSRGKPREGAITIEIVRRSGRVVFACSDDGGGIDIEAVRRAAVDRGMAPEQARALGSEELIALLLKGGLSTSRSVTVTAGRGIGLDVLREAASRLGGEVDVRSTPERGTRVELRVPMSLSALDALLVDVAGQQMAIPLDVVHETLRLAPTDIARNNQGTAVLFRDKLIPFARVDALLGASPMPRRSAETCSALIIEVSGAVAALGVDRLIGVETVAFRALPASVPAKPTIAGALLDAESIPRLMLAPEGLIAELAVRPVAEPDAPPPRRPVLVIDDSLTTRMLEQSVLEAAGYEVDLAISAEEGLLKARERSYALFLVDVEMPGMDGFTFIERIRADPELAKTPAILVTSRSAPEDRLRGERVGASGYVIKGEFNQVEFLDRIEKLLGS